MSICVFRSRTFWTSAPRAWSELSAAWRRRAYVSTRVELGLDPLELGDRVVQLGGRELAKLAAEALAERARGGARFVELGVDPRVVRPLIEVRQVPLDLLCAGEGGRHVLEPIVR